MAKRALVLGGGGARGPYQIGVWQALRELGVDFDLVVGSSVGALNAAMIAQDDFDVARDLWENLSGKDVMVQPGPVNLATAQGRRELADYLKHIVELGGLDNAPLEAVVRRVVDEERLRASPIRFGLITVHFPLLRAEQLMIEDIPAGKVVDYLLASSTYFPFFHVREIDGHRYVDGGFSDNMPAAFALQAGAEELIVVDLQARAIVHRLRSDVPLTYIRCHWPLGQVMNFDAGNAGRNMLLGYHDTLKAYRRLEGSAYAFHPGETRRNARAFRERLAHIRARSGVSLFKQYQRIPKIQEALRYHDKRFIKYSSGRYTFGNAVTTAAEIAGELLGLPPDRVYDFGTFHTLLREAAAFLHTPTHPPARQPGRRASRTLLHQLFSMLRHACEHGAVPQSFWGLVALAPREFIAAYYLLALLDPLPDKM